MDDDELLEATTIDEARLQMCKQLHRAIYGDVWARPETPVAVWQRLLGVVSDLVAEAPRAPDRLGVAVARDGHPLTAAGRDPRQPMNPWP